MEAEEKIPTLLQLIFGEMAAGEALRGASPRLLLWCRAFDEWLEERERNHLKAARKHAVIAWRRLLQNCKKLPWRMETRDIVEQVEWMRAQGLADTTVHADLGLISMFFRWCGEKGVDPACEPDFNPANHVPRPKILPTSPSTLLSRAEVAALLRTLQADRSPLGRREHAFILARLKLGVNKRKLQRLQWGQIRIDESGAWVRWRPEAEPARLPEEVWEAVRVFLEESGRLPTLMERSFIFTGISDWHAADPGHKAEDWSDRPLSTSCIRENLKHYGRLAGIAEEKLSYAALRRTAIRLRIDAGDSPEELHAFLDRREPVKDMKIRLRRLPALPEEREEDTQRSGNEIVVPVRKTGWLRDWNGYIHGFYARSQPLEAVRAVIAENIQGLEEQISALRALGRGLLQSLENPPGEAALQLVSVYGQVAGWLAELVRIEDDLDEIERERKKPAANVDEPEIENNKKRILEVAYLLVEAGEIIGFPESEINGEGGLKLASRLLEEEIASLRFVLRNTLVLAAEAEEAGEYTRLVQLYGSGSVRLARLLKREAVAHGQMESTAEAQKLYLQYMVMLKCWGGEVWEHAPTFEEWRILMRR